MWWNCTGTSEAYRYHPPLLRPPVLHPPRHHLLRHHQHHFYFDYVVLVPHNVVVTRSNIVRMVALGTQMHDHLVVHLDTMKKHANVQVLSKARILMCLLLTKNRYDSQLFYSLLWTNGNFCWFCRWPHAMNLFWKQWQWPPWMSTWRVISKHHPWNMFSIGLKLTR
jgi:hypothetical protein